MAMDANPAIRTSMASGGELFTREVFDVHSEIDKLLGVVKALEDERGVLQLVGLTQHRCSNLHEFMEASNQVRSGRTHAGFSTQP